MDRSPLFPQVPFLGWLARGMVLVACVLAAFALLCIFTVEVSNHAMLTRAGISLALGGTGKFLLKARDNGASYLCGLVGWLIVALV